MNRRTSWRVLGAVVAYSGILTPVAHSQESTSSLDLELGAERSDNVTRVPVDEQSETIGTARIGLAIEQHRPKLDADISGDVQYQRYFDETYDNEVLGGVDAS